MSDDVKVNDTTVVVLDADATLDEIVKQYEQHEKTILGLQIFLEFTIGADLYFSNPTSQVSSKFKFPNCSYKTYNHFTLYKN